MSWVPAVAWEDKSEKLLREQRLISTKRLAQRCDNCGEAGRTKAVDWTGGVEHVWCNDDHKSCYGYSRSPDRVVTFVSREDLTAMRAANLKVPDAHKTKAMELRKKWMAPDAEH